MTEDFIRNTAVIQQRWPELYNVLVQVDITLVSASLISGLSSTLLVDGIQLTSRHDRVKEAVLQAQTLPRVPVLHLYGTGLGDLQFQLLQRTELKKLHVHILNENLFAFVLCFLDQSEWLNDDRVELLLASAHKEIQQPFFAMPAELLLASVQAAKIRDRLVAEIEIQFVNQRFNSSSPRVADRIISNENVLSTDADVSALFDMYSGRDAYILATGPTLELHYEQLSTFTSLGNHPVLICLDTALRPLTEHGITPDIVVSIDELTTRLHFPDEISPDIKLVYFPMVMNETLLSWQGKRYAAYSYSGIYDEMNKKYPKSRLYSNGSVIHPAVDLAVKLGVKTITLFGADFCFPNNKTHAGWNDGVLGESINSARHWVVNGKGEKIKTLLNFRSYLCGLERYIARHPEVRFFNTSRLGAVIEGTEYHPEFTQ